VSRTRTLAAFASLLGLTAWGLAAQSTGKAPTPKASPAASKTPTPTPAPRVFTNDDLEAAKKKGGAVQDLKATGTEPYEPEPPLEEPQLPTPEPTPELDPAAQRIADLEAQIKTLDESAKALLWGYLQSTDTNEILRIKAEQQEILNQLDAARAELAQLKGEAAGAPPAVPTATPTPPPG
jgi:hypothetical protein